MSTRWLSLEVFSHVLQLYNSSVSYFKSTDEHQTRFSCPRKLFSDPMMEIYLLFLQSVFPLFTHFNLLLQHEDSMIFLLCSQMTAFVKNLLSRFVKPQVIVDCGDSLAKVEFSELSNQLEDKKLYIGMMTKSKLN